MKNISIIILTLLLFVPPVQAHVDAIVLNDITESHVDAFDVAHQDAHHRNDSDEEKETEHHHHCTVMIFTGAIISPSFKYNFSKVFKVKKEIIFYQTLHTSNFLDELLQPPQV
ncbi:hypothetical protein [Tenacibaculum ovolyticum]|uniref:hypothetical protein n=1 Tax=Tenacibaculum ovolyticum TaxID=104270 RepID=UPI0012DE4D7A|nr:hypothetical protein [Tenacibaculum ovolyticum]